MNSTSSNGHEASKQVKDALYQIDIGALTYRRAEVQFLYRLPVKTSD
jgi:hypothetical protein